MVPHCLHFPFLESDHRIPCQKGPACPPSLLHTWMCIDFTPLKDTTGSGTTSRATMGAIRPNTALALSSSSCVSSLA